MKERIITGVIGGAGFLGLLWLGDIWYSALIYVLAIGSFYEFLRMRKTNWFVQAGIVGILFLITLLSFEIQFFSLIMLIWITVFILLFFTVASKNKATIEDVAYIFVGLLYIGIGFYFMKAVRLENGFEWALLTIALVWGTDTGAYFSGRIFGRHKLWPDISPKKTVEGALGGTVIAIIIAVLFYYYGNSVQQLSHALLIGAVIAIVAQFGDLIESAIKRTFSIKDSGQILPGHGGFFDRFDSMIAVFPVMSFIITMLYQ